MPRRSDIQAQIIIQNRRLQKLKQKQAAYGLGVDPGVEIEIEDIEAQLERLESELATLPPDDLVESVPLSGEPAADSVQSHHQEGKRAQKVVKITKGSYVNRPKIIGIGDIVTGTKIVYYVSVPLLVLILVILASTLNLVEGVHRLRDPGRILHPIWPLPTATPTPTPTPIPIPKMSENFFNIGVSKFPELAALGELEVTEASSEVSDFLFKIIQEISQQPGLAANVRGPELIKVIEGRDFEARAEEAARVAIDHNANFLIYGVVTRSGDSYQIEPEFYLSHKGFGYGNEITGPSRLGQPIIFTLPLNSPELESRLRVRTQVLQRVVMGLHHFYFNDYEPAWGEFYQTTIALKNNKSEVADLEILHLFMGAAKLQSFSSKLPPEKGLALLDEAAKEFDYAYQLNPNYGRTYLGLGQVAFQRAILTDTIDEAGLLEAAAWYTRSLEVPDQPLSAYVSLKSDFGLGLIHLKGYQARLPNWSGPQAGLLFSRVITAYNQNPSLDLAEIAGHAHAQLGWLAGDSRNWVGMSAEYSTAVTLLSSVPGYRLNDWIALYWAQLGCAEKRLNHEAASRQAYTQAVSLSEKVPPDESRAFTPEQLNQWREEARQLSKECP